MPRRGGGAGAARRQEKTSHEAVTRRALTAGVHTTSTMYDNNQGKEGSAQETKGNLARAAVGVGRCDRCGLPSSSVMDHDDGDGRRFSDTRPAHEILFSTEHLRTKNEQESWSRLGFFFFFRMGAFDTNFSMITTAPTCHFSVKYQAAAFLILLVFLGF